MFLLPVFLVLLGYFAAYPMICLAADRVFSYGLKPGSGPDPD